MPGAVLVTEITGMKDPVQWVIQLPDSWRGGKGGGEEREGSEGQMKRKAFRIKGKRVYLNQTHKSCISEHGILSP